MTTEQFALVLGEIEEQWIAEAAESSPRRRRFLRCRHPAAAAAACLLLVVALGLPILLGKGGQDDAGAETVAAFAYHGAYYEAVDLPEVLARYGLPTRLSADLAGQPIEWLEPDGGVGYRITARETGIRLYQYAPAPCEGVYLIRDGERWLAALFCNFRQFDSNTSRELTELYRVYGIHSSADIASVAEVSWDRDLVRGNPVTDAAALGEFYRLTTSIWSVGQDDFDHRVFGEIPEAEQAAAHAAFADDLRILRVETTAGLRFFLDLHPSFAWLQGGGTLSWFPMEAALMAWFEGNFPEEANEGE